MNWVVVCSLILYSGLGVRAENTNKVDAKVEINPWNKPDRPTDFDNDVFKVGLPPTANELSKSPNGTVRPREEGGNASVMAEARDKCENEKAKSMKAYRKCYQDAMKQNSANVRERVQAVERNQTRTFRNTQALPDPASLPTYGNSGGDSESGPGDGDSERD